MTNEMINEREHRVLEAIVRNYIGSAAPTSSRFLSKQEEFNYSAATIRNIMSDLEERGYLCQPHTSAGRVPTDKAYRYYVDRLMKSMVLPQPVRSRIREAIRTVDASDLHLVMETASRALSRATNQLGVVLSPRLRSGIFKHVHIFELHPGRYILNLTVNAGLVRTMTVELQTEIPASRLEHACRIINERFFGMALEEMVVAEDTAFNDIEPCDFSVVRLFIPSIKKLVESGGEDMLHAEGETNIMLQPEFFDKERIGAVIEILKDKKVLLHLFDVQDADVDRPVISIGCERADGSLNAFSIIKRRYSLREMNGCVGIIGPKRMQYPLLVSAVDYTAVVLEEIYSKD